MFGGRGLADWGNRGSGTCRGETFVAWNIPIEVKRRITIHLWMTNLIWVFFDTMNTQNEQLSWHYFLLPN